MVHSASHIEELSSVLRGLEKSGKVTFCCKHGALTGQKLRKMRRASAWEWNEEHTQAEQYSHTQQIVGSTQSAIACLLSEIRAWSQVGLRGEHCWQCYSFLLMNQGLNLNPVFLVWGTHCDSRVSTSSLFPSTLVASSSQSEITGTTSVVVDEYILVKCCVMTYGKQKYYSYNDREHWSKGVKEHCFNPHSLENIFPLYQAVLQVSEPIVL